MDAARLTLFRNARAFERDLNARQREVLARIAKGQTNSEIAAALDMTFDGAKWNVSEILTKLSLSSREEAAAYWHWQGIGSRVGSALRALVPASLTMKLVAGGGGLAAIAIVVVLFALMLGSETNESSPEVPPFRMVATFQSATSRGSITTIVTFELQDRTHSRTETVRDDPVDGRVVSTSVADGRNLWQTSSNLETYTRVPLPTASEIANSPRGTIGVGAAGSVSLEAYLDWLVSEYPEPDANGVPFSRVIGSDTLLGVPVTIIEYGPVANIGALERVLSAGSDSVGRLWLDTTTMFVLRSDAELTDESRTQIMQAEVISIEYDVEFAPETFTFVPPPGKREAVPTPATQSNVP